MHRVMIFSILLLMAVSSPSLAADGKKASGNGASVQECIARSNHSPDEIRGLSCTGLKSLDGIENFPKLEQLALAKGTGAKRTGAKDADSYTLTAADTAVADNVVRLLLVGKGWNEEDINVLAQALPAVRNVQCRLCDINELGWLSKFDELSVIQLDLMTVIEAHWYYGKEPDPEITFEGLPYDRIHRISIQTTPKSNISCRALGVWQTKASTYFSGRRNYPRPYKDMAACYPRIYDLRELILEGDAAYQAGKLEEAHRKYREAFEINPYDQRAISSLALTSLKQGDACAAAQVAASGTELENGIAATRASIHYNLYLALLELGDIAAARDALARSHEIRPGESKQQALAEMAEMADQAGKPASCNLEHNWITELRARIETAAVERSRGSVNPYAGKDFSNYTVVKSEFGEKTTDYLWIEFRDVKFEPGYYGIIVRAKPDVNRSSNRRQTGMSCDASRRGVSPKNNREHLLDERFMMIQDGAYQEIELQSFFRISEPENFELCIFGGDAWWMESGDYLVELVRFKGSDFEQ